MKINLFTTLVYVAFLCNAYAQVQSTPSGDPYRLIIYVDQPGAGGDRDPYEVLSLHPLNVDVGHSWWKFKVDASKLSLISSDLQPFANQPVGYYPAHGVGFFQTTDDGKLKMPDTAHSPEVHKTYALTKEQIEAGLTYTKNLHDTPGTYDLNSHNCTDATIQAGIAAGQNIPATHGTWPNGGGCNPGDLGEDLRQ